MTHTFAACKNCHALNKIQITKAQEALCGKCHSPIILYGLVSEATTDDFHRILRSSDKLVIVDFWASWCGPCKIYGPQFEKASLSNDSAVFIKINTESEQELSTQLGVRGIPCTIVFRGGREIFRQAGAMDAASLNNLLKNL
jgi:thioredoxin 2